MAEGNDTWGALPPSLEIGPLVTWVVSSLYLDQAVPRGSLLQWMLQLIIGVKLNPRQLRDCIDAAPGVYVEPPDAKKLSFTAMLDVVPTGFKGFVSESEFTSATLGEEIWHEVCRCLAMGGWPKPEDISHKYYVVASWLQDESDKFQHLSFGRVLSIVRSSMSTSGLLGHRGGLLVPYALSEECERRVNACTGQPTHVAPDEVYVKTWDELRDLLSRLIASAPDGQVQVCKLKVLMRQEFKIELSETVFGHQSLSKLLADAHLEDKFELAGQQLVPGGKYVIRLRSQPDTSSKDDQ